MAKNKKELLSVDSRSILTLSKRLLVPATLTITSGRHSLQTVTHGVKPSTRPCPLSKKTAWTASRRNDTGGRHVWLRFQSQTRPSPATTATGHASPASALSATSVPAGDVDDPLLNLRSRSHAMMRSIWSIGDLASRKTTSDYTALGI